MELRHLRYFVVAAETLNFSKAAKLLYISQPGLSKNIAELECLLNAELFRRESGKLSLTSAGEYLLKEARKLLSDAARIEKEIQLINASDRPVCTIALEDKVAETWGNEYLYALQSLKERYPLWDIRVCPTSLDEISGQVQDQRVAFGVVMHHDPKALKIKHYRKIGEDKLGILCHKSSAADFHSFEDVRRFLSETPLIIADHRANIREHSAKVFEDLNLSFRSVQTAEPNIAIMHIRIRDGALLLAKRLLGPGIGEDLAFLEFPSEFANLNVYAFWESAKLQPMIDDFCTGFMEMGAEIGRG